MACQASRRPGPHRGTDRNPGPASLTEEHAKHIRGRIWELRPRTDGMTGRALYVTVTGKRVIIVLCAIKKTQTTPKRWIDLAEMRARTIDTGETT
ncbi:type II toxin-antitoxin system RelE/ParE family toxin [Methylobacterium sp. J-077]|uniref:type II toxin-antitoxin system RelE/ParE family toxin n=1 Tax=Methylobacterium sp. J-077 TaxID=2836656 RepID=UPI00391E0288